MASLIALLDSRKSRGFHLKLLRNSIQQDITKIFGHLNGELTLNRPEEIVTASSVLQGTFCIRTDHQIDHFGKLIFTVNYKYGT